MKKILLIICIFISSFTVFSQVDSNKFLITSRPWFYLSGGVQYNFSYPGIDIYLTVSGEHKYIIQLGSMGQYFYPDTLYSCLSNNCVLDKDNMTIYYALFGKAIPTKDIHTRYFISAGPSFVLYNHVIDYNYSSGSWLWSGGPKSIFESHKSMGFIIRGGIELAIFKGFGFSTTATANLNKYRAHFSLGFNVMLFQVR